MMRAMDRAVPTVAHGRPMDEQARPQPAHRRLGQRWLAPLAVRVAHRDLDSCPATLLVASNGKPGAPAHTAHSAGGDGDGVDLKHLAGPGHAAPGTASATRSSSCRWTSDLIVVAHGSLVQVIETKFVEPEFSICGFRKAGRAKKGQDVCPQDVAVRDDRGQCLYVRNKGYAYWQRTDQHGLLAPDAVPARGCPFGGARWQLWVNLALAHEEAARRDASDVRFAVCSSSRNTALLGDGVLGEFKALVREPSSVSLFDLEEVLARLSECAPADLADWARAMSSRYADI